MKTISPFAILFSWIFFVLLVYQLNYHPRVYFHKTLVVTQTGENANLSLDDLNSLEGLWPNWTFCLSGLFTKGVTLNISGTEKGVLAIDGDCEFLDKRSLIMPIENETGLTLNPPVSNVLISNHWIIGADIGISFREIKDIIHRK